MHNAKWVDALINALPTTSNEELNASRGAYVKWRAILSTQKLETTQRFVDNERALGRAPERNRFPLGACRKKNPMNESLEDEKKAQNGRDIIALWTLYRFNEEQCRYARLAGFDAWLPQHLIDNMPIINARNVHNLNESFRRFAGCVEDLPNRTDDGESSSRCARSSRFPRSSVFGDLVSLDPNTRNVR